MKCFFVVAISILMLSPLVIAQPVSESRKWTEIYNVATPTPQLSISNIWGRVRVRPGASDKISVTIEEHRVAPDQKRFERTLEILKLNIDADSNGVLIHVGNRSKDQKNLDNNCKGCRVDYQFEVLVPVGTQLNVGTINDGEIDVAGIVGSVKASNINGPVSVSGLHNCEVVESINGKVDLSFSFAPDQDCKIKTINGDITIATPGGFGLNLAADLFNGRMISEFELESIALPAVVDRTHTQGRHRYKVQQSMGVHLEGGGPTFSISSLNGDIRIQKAQ